MPPSMPTSQSAVASSEGASDALSPEMPTLQQSVSADNASAFSTIRDGIAGLSVLNPLGRVSSPSSSSAPVPVKNEEELREMT